MRYPMLFESPYSSVPWCGSRGLPMSAVNEEAGRRQRIVARKLRIFVVDDDPNFRGAFRTSLHDDYDATVDVINCGEDALAIPLRQYDVIFIDVVMPGMSGIVVCERLLARHLNALIALMSTNSDHETAAQEHDVSFYDKMDVARLEDILFRAAEGRDA